MNTNIDANEMVPATADEMTAILAQSEYLQYTDTTQIRHPATGRIIGGNGFDGPDDQLNVEFSTEAVFNKLLTYRAGGVPKYVDMDFITISTPGDNKVTVHTPVTEYHQWRFPVEYANFKKGQGELLAGTPLALWPLLTQSQIREMTNLGVRTVEQIANMSDSNAGAFSGFYGLKTKAKQFLELAGDKAAQGKLQAELDVRDTVHKNEIASMKAQLDQLMQIMMAKEDAEKAAKAELEKPVERAVKLK
jgi:hypothetical protein